VKATLVILSVLLVALQFAVADDFKTIDGKEYKNVKVSRVEPDGIVVITKAGISKIYFTELPQEIQTKYGYDPEAAAGFQKQAYEAGLARARGIVDGQASTRARNAEVAAKSAAEGRALATQQAIGGFSLSANESGSQAHHSDTWRTDYGSYDQTTTHGKRVKVSVHDVGGHSAVCTIHVYFVAKSLAKGAHLIYSDQERQLAINGGIEDSILVDAPPIQSRVLNLQALGEQYVSGVEMEGWIVTGSVGGQVFGMHASNGAVGSDAWTLINEFQNRSKTTK
jgi:hypothetical protein